MATATTEVACASGNRVVAQTCGDGTGDEALLDRFLNGLGEDPERAFGLLVERHGPMVLAVCRHVLNGHHDAEDAFQATFLVLARDAAAIRDRRVLGRWLYEVAYRISLQARTRAVRRRTNELEAVKMSAAQGLSESDPGWLELRPVLHEEIHRLPEKYRTPVVLCYLEGRTNEEAAELLDWPVGTVKGRLSRARELLRSRLTRRGLALAAAFLMTRLGQDAGFAEIVPSELSETTTRHAVASTHGGTTATVSPSVRELVGAQLGRAVGRLRPTLIRVGLMATLAVALLTIRSRGQGILSSSPPAPRATLPAASAPPAAAPVAGACGAH